MKSHMHYPHHQPRNSPNQQMQHGWHLGTWPYHAAMGASVLVCDLRQYIVHSPDQCGAAPTALNMPAHVLRSVLGQQWSGELLNPNSTR